MLNPYDFESFQELVKENLCLYYNCLTLKELNKRVYEDDCAVWILDLKTSEIKRAILDKKFNLGIVPVLHLEQEEPFEYVEKKYCIDWVAYIDFPKNV